MHEVPGGCGASDSVTFSFEGREIECRAGVSVAAALANAGEFGLRAAANGEMRGIFCGMGVCQECRVSVDDRHGVRACMTVAEAGMRVYRGGPGEASGPGSAERRIAMAEPELLVIGAGAGGLTAASIAAEAGVDVVLVDERHARGGQYFKQPVTRDLLPASLADDRQIADGERLVMRALQSGATVVADAQVWGAFAPAEFGVLTRSGSTMYRPQRTIVATGAFERALPLPGWTLPGVMTTGAAQGMLRNYGTFPSGRIVVAGNGPLNLQVALELERAGADVVLVAELAAAPPAVRAAQGLKMAMHALGLTLDGVRMLRDLRRAGVKLQFGTCLAAVRPGREGLDVTLRSAAADGTDREQFIEADVVCVGYGFQPSNEILRCLGCRHGFDPARGNLCTERNEVCETTVPGVFAVGDCAGFSGAPAALQDGVIAGVAAARSLGYSPVARHARELRRALRERRRSRAFQSALWTLFAAPRYSTQLATAETTVCRCENVTLGAVNAAIDDGAVTMGGIKQRTRLGMGPCQGRYCAPITAELLAERIGQPIDEYSYFAPRPPLKPVRISDIVGRRES